MNITRILLVSGTMGFCAVAQALPVVDGNLSEWGVSVGDGTSAAGSSYNLSQMVTLGNGSHELLYPGATTTSNPYYNVNSGNAPSSTEITGYKVNGVPTVTNGSTHPIVSNPYNVMVEDTDDTAGISGSVGPHQGGQNYDAEFLAALADVSTGSGELYLALMDGGRPDNPYNQFAPGDFYLALSDLTMSTVTVFGIEVGGGAGGQSSFTEISGGDVGYTYDLNGSGYTQSNEASSTTTVGTILETASTDWKGDDEPTTDLRKQLIGGTLAGTVDNFVFAAPLLAGTTNYSTTHSAIELSLGLDKLGVEANHTYGLDVVWMPACGNDQLYVHTEFTRTQQVPEPASLGLLGIGFAAFGGLRRRFKR